ncbi:MAG: RDD family protein [Spirochaetia bacterium]|nr:RDD family protein [Spirochaetia bacterium]
MKFKIIMPRYIFRIVFFLFALITLFICLIYLANEVKQGFIYNTDFGGFIFLLIIVLSLGAALVLTKMVSERFLRISIIDDQNQMETGYQIASIDIRVKALLFDALAILGIIVIISKIVLFFKIQSVYFDALAILFIFFLYEPIMVSFFLGTIGHKLMGLKVLSINGEKILILVSLIRFFIKSFLGIFSLISMLFGKHHALHDLLTGTMVVYKKSEKS